MLTPSRPSPIPAAVAVLAVVLAVGVLQSPSYALGDKSQSSATRPSADGKSPASSGRPAPDSASVAPAPAATAMPDYGGRDSLPETASPVDAAGGSAGNPLAQAWRAFEALVVVLVFSVGAVFIMKKYGLVKEPHAPAGAVGTPAGFAGSLIGGWRQVVGNASASTAPLGNRQKSAVTGGEELPYTPAPSARGKADAESAGILHVVASSSLPGSSAGVHILDVGGRRFLLGSTQTGVNLIAEWDIEPESLAAIENSEVDDDRFESYLNSMGMTAQTPPDVIGEGLSKASDRLQAMLTRAREEA